MTEQELPENFTLEMVRLTRRLHAVLVDETLRDATGALTALLTTVAKNAFPEDKETQLLWFRDIAQDVLVGLATGALVRVPQDQFKDN